MRVHCWCYCDSAEWNVTKETSIKRRTCTHSPSNSRAYASSVSEHKTRRNTTANRAPVRTSETILTNVPNPIYTMQSRIYSAGFEYSVHRSHRECDEKYYAAVRRLTVPSAVRGDEIDFKLSTTPIRPCSRLYPSHYSPYSHKFLCIHTHCVSIWSALACDTKKSRRFLQTTFLSLSMFGAQRQSDKGVSFCSTQYVLVMSTALMRL